MAENLRRVEIGNYLLLLTYFPSNEGLMALPDRWHVITYRPVFFADGRYSGSVVTRQQRWNFVGAAVAFKNTVARVRSLEEKRLLSTPMIPGVPCA